jgi:hypothetical protein
MKNILLGLLGLGVVTALMSMTEKPTSQDNDGNQSNDDTDTGAGNENDLLNVDYRSRVNDVPAIRNNNPGNLIVSSSPWKGKVKTNGKFEIFQTFAYGTRAMIKLLQNKLAGQTAKGKKLDNINDLITDWAPPRKIGGDNSDKEVENYISKVCQYSGFTRDEKLTADKETLKKLVLAMSRVEAGKESVTTEMFEASWGLLYKQK